MLSSTTCFTDIITEDYGYATIRKVGTDELYCEIELGPKLRFLNYVAFSYDSRYVAIVGRYPDNCFYKGLLLIYDMDNHKEIKKILNIMPYGQQLLHKKAFMQPMTVCRHYCMEMFMMILE